MTRKKHKIVAPAVLTVAATPAREVAVVVLYNTIQVAHVLYTPDEARALAADITAAAHRADNPRAARIIRTEPDYREGPLWFDKHSEEL